MFAPTFHRNRIGMSISMAERMFHATVRMIGAGHSNAVVALALSIVQALVMVGMFFLMFWLLGVRSAPLRGDFILYIISGVFLYRTHVKAVTAVSGAESSTSAMMQHGPMNTAIAICSTALSTLYTQTLSALVILFAYHTIWAPITIEDPIGAYGMFLLAWISGVGIGMILYALRPWFPTFTPIATRVYARVNMLASGKMFLANMLPAKLLVMFDWNPLFHAIDQSRGYTFINYFPRNSSISYPVYVTIALLLFGLMAEFYTRQYASKSWSDGR